MKGGSTMKKMNPILLLVLTGSLLGLYCSIKPFEAPKWETQLNIVLSNVKFVVSDLANDSTIVINSDNLLQYNLEEEFEPQIVGDSLYIDASSESYTLLLEDLFVIPTDEYLTDPIRLQMFLPDEIFSGLPPDGTPLPISVPPFDISSLDLGIVEFTEFFSIDVSSCQLITKLHNNFFFDLQLNQAYFLELSISDAVSGNYIHSIIFDEPIPVDSTRIIYSELNITTIPNRLHFTVNGSCAGISAGTIVDRSKNFCDVVVQFDDISVAGATAKIPAQLSTYEGSVNFGTEWSISEAQILEGSLIATIHSFFPAADADFYFLDFTRNNEVLVIEDLSLLPNQPVIVSVPLNDVKFEPQTHNRIHYYHEIFVHSSGDSFITFSASDELTVDLDINQITFDFVRGQVNNLIYNIPPQIEPIEDLPDSIENLNIEEVIFLFHIFKNQIDIPFSLQLEIIGWNSITGASNSITVDQYFPVNEDSISFYVEDTEQIFNLLPDSIKISGQVAVNGAGEVHRQGYVRGYVEISVPAALSFDDFEWEADIDNVDEIDEIDRIEAITLNLKMSNHTPFAGNVIIVAATDSADLVNHVEMDTLAAVSMPNAGEVNENGLVQTPGYSEDSVLLDKSKLELFESPAVYILPFLSIEGTNGQVVKLRADDYVSVLVHGRLTVLIGERED